MMSEEGNSSGAAQVCFSPEIVACIQAIMDKLLDKRDGQRRDGSVEHALGGASGSIAAVPPGTMTGVRWNCLVLLGSRLL